MTIYGVQYDNGEAWEDKYVTLTNFFTTLQLAEEFCKAKQEENLLSQAKELEEGHISWNTPNWSIKELELEGFINTNQP